jgi:hypothetical protein
MKRTEAEDPNYEPVGSAPSQLTRRDVAAALFGVVGAAGLVGCLGEDGALPTDPEQLGCLRDALSGTSCYWCQTIGSPTSPGDLRLLAAKTPVVCVAQGFWSAGDGGGGLFFLDRTSTESDNYGTIVPCVSGGRWKRIYSGPLNVKWFGAMGNGASSDTDALQKAIDTADGAPIFAPPGKYVVTATLNYSNTSTAQGPGLRLSGAGPLKTVFESRVANGPMLRLNSYLTTPPRFQKGGKLEGFTITAPASPPTAGDGIEFWANWFLTIRDVQIAGLAGTGIKIGNAHLDADSSNFVSLVHVELSRNGGYGLQTVNTTMGSAMGGFEFQDCYITFNTRGGICCALIDPRIIGGAIAFNGGIGFWSTAEATTTRPIVEHVEFDRNAEAHIRLDKCYSARIAYNNFKASALNDGVFCPPVSVVVGNGGAWSGLAELRGNFVFTAIPSGSAHTAFSVGTTASRTRIIDNFFSPSSPVVHVADQGQETVIRDDNLRTGDAIRTASVTTSGSYSPNLSEGVYHRIIVSSGNSFVVNNPAGNVTQGKELILDIFNKTAVPLTVSLGTEYRCSPLSPVTSYRRRTARFIREPVGDDWIQVGDWSPEFI